jgi:hypothetical protein
VADGILAGYTGVVAPPADGGLISATALSWSQYRQMAFQLLVLLDASGSMNDEVRQRDGTLTTKADLLRGAGAQAAQLFGPETSVGLWTFGTPTPTSPAYTEVVPFGALSDRVQGTTRRELTAKALGTYRAYPNAGTPLYESVLRAVETMQSRQRPDAVTIVFVLTDGRDEQSRYAMSPETFFAKLPARGSGQPVPVFCVGYGADADMATLNDIAARTGGTAVASSDPDDLASSIAKLFLAAHQTPR